MNHLLYNFSIIMIILGIVFLTKSITEASFKCDLSNLTKENNKPKIIKDVPSKVFDKMFDSPSVWMGYSDFDSKEFLLKNKK